MSSQHLHTLPKTEFNEALINDIHVPYNVTHNLVYDYQAVMGEGELFRSMYNLNNYFYISAAKEWIPAFLIFDSNIRLGKSLPYALLNTYRGRSNSWAYSSATFGGGTNRFSSGGRAYTNNFWTSMSIEAGQLDLTTLRIEYMMFLQKDFWQKIRMKTEKDRSKFTEMFTKEMYENRQDIRFIINEDLKFPSSVRYISNDRRRFKEKIFPRLMNLGIKTEYMTNDELIRMASAFEEQVFRFRTLDQMKEEKKNLLRAVISDAKSVYRIK